MFQIYLHWLLLIFEHFFFLNADINPWTSHWNPGIIIFLQCLNNWPTLALFFSKGIRSWQWSCNPIRYSKWMGQRNEGLKSFEETHWSLLHWGQLDQKDVHENRVKVKTNRQRGSKTKGVCGARQKAVHSSVFVFFSRFSMEWNQSLHLEGKA